MPDIAEAPSTSQTDIQVTPAQTAVDVPSINAPPKPGSAKAKMFSDLSKYARQPGEDTSVPRKPQKETPKAQAPAEEVEEVQEVQETPEAQETPEKPGDEQVQPDPKTQNQPKDKAKRPNPWKVIDEWKAKYATLEKQIAESKGKPIEPAEKTELTSKLDAAQKRLEELEKEMVYVNYEKSKEFDEKYRQPYNNKWKQAMSELSELTVETENGERPFSPQDMLELVNLPLREANKLATEKYNEFAPYVMSHRKEIRALFEAQSQALDKARTEGLEKAKAQQAQNEKILSEMQGSIKATWEKVNDAVTKDPKYGQFFKPEEGNQEWNQRLAKGYELVDRAYGENPANPQLTPEQRESIIKRHAAVRNRAAAFGAVQWKLNRALEQLAAAQKELAGYKGSTPPSGGNTRNAGAPIKSGTAKDSVFAALRARAK